MKALRKEGPISQRISRVTKKKAEPA